MQILADILIFVKRDLNITIQDYLIAPNKVQYYSSIDSLVQIFLIVSYIQSVAVVVSFKIFSCTWKFSSCLNFWDNSSVHYFQSCSLSIIFKWLYAKAIQREYVRMDYSMTVWLGSNLALPWINLRLGYLLLTQYLASECQPLGQLLPFFSIICLEFWLLATHQFPSLCHPLGQLLPSFG